MKRLMCLYLPYLSIDRLRMSDDSAPDQRAIAVTETVAGAVRVVLCNGIASDGGVCQGMTLAEAKAVLPSLRLEDCDGQADLGALMELAEWATAFSPVVQPEGIDTLLLDATGCELLFGGEFSLLNQALGGLRGRGFISRGAIADTAGSAWAIAHAHREDAVVTRCGCDLEEIARLPVSSLRIEHSVVRALGAVGVETVETLMSLPRSSLAARFGEGLLRRLGQALGSVAEPLKPFEAWPVLRSHLRLGAATDRLDIIQRAVEHVLSDFCEQLVRRMVGVTRLCVTFYCPAAPSVTLSVTLSVPTRMFKRLRKLLTVRLDQVRLQRPTDCVMVWAGQLEKLDDRQDELFDTQWDDDRESADLVDRLTVRLGKAAVGRVVLVSDYLPELAFGYGKKEGTKGRRDVGTEGVGVRPLLVWRRPVEVGIVAATSDGRPAMFRFKSVEHEVVACTGPERIETGWWRGRYVQRDYFRVVSGSGEAFWIFHCRDGGKWYLHGMFD